MSEIIDPKRPPEPHSVMPPEEEEALAALEKAIELAEKLPMTRSIHPNARIGRICGIVRSHIIQHRAYYPPVVQTPEDPAQSVEDET